jgi:uncharacterized RDD family membrane protein YckC
MTNPSDPGEAQPRPPETQPTPGPAASWGSPVPPTQQQPPPTPWTAPPPEVGPAPGVRFASHGPRLVAYIIDALIVGLVISVVVVLMSIVFFAGPGMSGVTSSDFQNGEVTPAMAASAFGFVLITIIIAILALAYFPWFWARSGQTPGMRMFGLYVVRDSDGGKISTGQAILRLIGYWISGLVFYLGFIWVFVDSRRRGWHDLIAGTVVIERAH